ncbi:MAG: hypothetical protein WDM90_02005 [Ferruginibacter sp.]
MKIEYINIKTALVAMALTGVMGCEKLKDFGTTNVNPGAISTPTDYALLTSVESGTDVNSGISTYVVDASLAPSAWIQHTSQTQYPNTGVYDVTTTYYGIGAYTGSLLNLRTIINNSSTPDIIAAARILTSYIYWKLTDKLEIFLTHRHSSAKPLHTTSRRYL